jgi:N utilization substance protein A
LVRIRSGETSERRNGREVGMNNELLTILSYMEKERGIERETLIQAVEYALQSAARKNYGASNQMRIQIDRKTCEIKAFAPMLIVEHVNNKEKEVALAKALETNPAARVGDVMDVEVRPANLGRIAAQTAKQAIIQRIRQAEKDVVFDEFKDRVGDIVSGTVRQFNRSDVVLDLGRTEAILPAKERVPTEEYQVGDRIRAYVVSVQQNAMGPMVTVSRSSPDFVRALFKLEVAEISDGVVEIKAIAREPGYRTKIAVASRDERVDPVGACVGMRGIRVKSIVRELSGEKVDIIRWSSDLKVYVANALSPAKLLKVSISPDRPNLVSVLTDAEQLSLAIGRRGQNIRLTQRLVGCKVDVQKDEANISFEEKKARAVSSMAAIPAIGQQYAEMLVNAGFLTVEGILAAEPKDIEEIAGVDAAVAKTIYEAVAAKQAEDGRTE